MRLKEIREQRGLTQRQAALGLNLSPTVYGRYENGLREPSNALLLVLADFFGVTVDELLGREPPQNQYKQISAERAALISLVQSAPEEKLHLLYTMIRAILEAQ